MHPPRRITLATYVTLSRFFLVPIFLCLFLKEHYATAILTLSLAAFTDVLDGFLARRFNMSSRLGSMLDPLADKFLMVTSFIVMSRLAIIPWGLTFLIIGKDLWVLAGVGALSLMGIRLYYKPTIVSKLTTFSQITLLSLSFLEVYLRHRPDEWVWIPRVFFVKLQALFLSLAAGMTLATLVQYSYIGYRFYRYGERKSFSGLN